MMRRTPLKRTPFRSRPQKPMRRSQNRLVEDLDRVFSFYVRLRDCMPGGYTRCISCGKVFPFDQMQCGHYHTRHHAATRWDGENCNSQCAYCNVTLGGNLGAYEDGLRMKIGDDAFDRLSVRHNGTVKWSDYELKDMILDYGLKAVALSEEKGVPLSGEVIGILKRHSV